MKKKNTMLNLTLLVLCTLSTLAHADIFQDLLRKNKQTNAQFSIYVVDAGSGKTRYSLNASTLRIPASNMKLVNSAAAVHYLGGDYKFCTKVAVLDKDLVIIGGGDPLLADPKHAASPAEASSLLMDRIAEAVRAASISEIENIVIDVSFFDNIRVHPSWPKDQLNQWYACEVSGLNFVNNCVFLTATRKGNSASLEMQPANSYVQLENQLQLISTGDSAVGAYRNSTPNKWSVKGKLNKQTGFDVAVENPAGLFAAVLCDHLSARGIAVKGQLLQKYVRHESSLRSLLVIETPIKDVLKRCNTNSLGLAAECLVKTISAENTHGRINGQWAHGLELTAGYLRSLGVAQTQYVLDDGSGLSRNNRLSAECIVAVLKDMYQGTNSAMFFDSLAVGGIEGTAAKYFNEAPYKGNIHGKTGYISGVRSFSGLCKTPKGDILFSILTEGGNSTTRTCINDLTKAIFDGRL